MSWLNDAGEAPAVHRSAPMPNFETIQLAIADGIATLTLNRPERMNAFTPAMAQEMIAAFDASDADDDVRVVIVTGAGRGF